VNCCNYPAVKEGESWRCVVTGSIVLDGIVLSTDEAKELHRYLSHEYLNPNTYPALLGLMNRLDGYVSQ